MSTGPEDELRRTGGRQGWRGNGQDRSHDGQDWIGDGRDWTEGTLSGEALPQAALRQDALFQDGLRDGTPHANDGGRGRPGPLDRRDPASVRTTRPRRVPQLYARPGRQMAGQLGGDAAFVVWLLLWAFVGRLVKHLVDALTIPTEKLADAAAQVSQSSGTAGDKVHRVPGIGGTIAEPFQVLHDQVATLSDAAHHQTQAIHHLAWGVGIVCFAIPVAVACWYWLPGRIRFIREATAARRFIDSDADLELFALRAMVHLSMRQLAAVSDDPVGDWRAGNRPVIDRLAALELKRQGLSMPRRRRPR